MVTAADIMTKRLRTTSASTDVSDAIDLLFSHGVSGLPVIDSDGQFEGRFSERTAISALDFADLDRDGAASALRSVHAANLMHNNSLVLRSSVDTFTAASLLLENRVSGAPVVDDLGNLLGVLSENSLMRVFIGLCWEQLPSARVTAWLDRDEDRQIPEDTRLDEILQRFQQSEFRRLIVVRGGQLVGQVNRRDALNAAAQRIRSPHNAVAGSSPDLPGPVMTVGAWMDREIPTIGLRADVLTIAHLFIHSSARQLPVVENMKMEGQISRCDLLGAVERFFPKTSGSGQVAQSLDLSSVRNRDEVGALS